MALEEIIAANTAAIEKQIAASDRQTAILEKLLSAGAKNAAATATTSADKAETAAPGSEEKPKTTAKPKADAKPKAETKTETSELTAAAMTDKIRPWLGEFAKDHVETAARRAKLAERLEKLDAPKNEKGARTVSAMEGDSDKLGKLNEWFDKIKVHDFGFGPGRVVADPAEDAGEEGGDDDL